MTIWITNSYIKSEIQGERGSMIIEEILKPEKIKIFYKDGREEEVSFIQDKPEMYYKAKEFVDTISKGRVESLIAPRKTSIKIMKIMDKIREEINLKFPAYKK